MELCCIGFWDGGTTGMGGRIPGTPRVHTQIFQGTAIIYIYIYIIIFKIHHNHL
jgi:hypothetical protein